MNLKFSTNVALAYNGSGITEGGDFGDEILNRSNEAPILHIPC